MWLAPSKCQNASITPFSSTKVYLQFYLNLFKHAMQLDAQCRASSAPLRDLLDAPTALAACCGFDLCHKYILYLYLYLYLRGTSASAKCAARRCSPRVPRLPQDCGADGEDLPTIEVPRSTFTPKYIQ